jgi:hypothetical protein
MAAEVHTYIALRTVELGADHAADLRELIAHAARHAGVAPFVLAMLLAEKLIACERARRVLQDYTNEDDAPMCGPRKAGRPRKRGAGNRNFV